MADLLHATATSLIHTAAQTRAAVLGHNVVTRVSAGVCLNTNGTPQGAQIITASQQRVSAV